MSEEEKTKEMVETPTKQDRRLSTGSEWTRGIDDLFEDFRRSFDTFMSPFVPMRSFLPRISTGFPVRAPLLDLMDKGDHYIIRAELPGFNKDMVNVELNKDMLVLSAEMKHEEETNQGYLHRERTYSQAQRTINFPEEVDPDNVEAKMTDGVLELKINKKEPAPEERMRKIQL